MAPLRVTNHVCAAGMPVRRMKFRTNRGVMPEDVLDGLRDDNERLVVHGRGACGADDAAVSSHFAASRGVPVLVVEP